MEIIKTTRYVTVLLFDSNGEDIVLIKKVPKEGRPDLLGGLWNGVGGKIQEGETELEAALRKVKAESGIDTDPELLKLFKFAHFSGPNWENTFFLDFTDTIYALQTLTDETVEIFSVEGSFNLSLAPSLRFLIPLALAIKENKEPVHFYEIRV